MPKEYKDNGMYSELLRYVDNSMSEDERKHIKALLKEDSFLKDAVDGLSLLKIDEIEDDAKSLRFIKSGFSTPNIVVVALFVVALAVFVVFMLFFNKKESADSEVDSLSSQFDFESSRSIEAPEIFDTVSSEMLVADSTTMKQNQIIGDSLQYSLSVENDDSIEGVVNDSDSNISDYSVQDNTPVKKSEEKQKKENPPVLLQDISNEETESISVQPVMEELDYAEPRDFNVKSMLNESVLPSEEPVSIDDSNEEEGMLNDMSPVVEPRTGFNAEPEPLGGREAFDEYVENNMRYPVTGKGRRVVKVAFTVGVDGNLSDFEISRSPNNEAFEQEAVRLISEGSRWSPAVKDGIPVKETEELRFVFKQ
ncbi:MAG: TonB family protein [Prolixibacteraceae bacterium]|jgi:TonB family protein|nr:TonB family protein [Prolixibacteraceae bacterium]